MNPMTRFGLVDSQGRLLHYIQGSLFWGDPDDYDVVMDCTKFPTHEQATAFVKDRNIGAVVGTMKITITLG